MEHTSQLRALSLELVPLVAVRAAVHDQLECRAVLARLRARHDALQVVRRRLAAVEHVFRLRHRGYDLRVG